MTPNQATPHSATPAAHAGAITIGGELHVNRMGFGAMRITGQGIWGPPTDRGECVRVLRQAVELGVNFIDTADSYGPFVSEEIIAEALHPYPADLVIATKGGLERPGPNKWTPNGRPEHLRRSLEGSLKRLKRDRIDLWQLHRIDSTIPADEQFDVLREFVRDGTVRCIGLSEVNAKQIEQAAQFVEVASVQNRYNIVDREWDDVVDYCQRHGMAFIPWFPLAAGSIESSSDNANAHQIIERVAKRHHATAMQIALAWLLARSPATVVIPGTSKTDHVGENIRAAEIELSEDELQELNQLG